jgi:hypothetical protein
MNLQRKRLIKHLLNKHSSYVSRFGALLCFMYLSFLLRLFVCGEQVCDFEREEIEETKLLSVIIVVICYCSR